MTRQLWTEKGLFDLSLGDMEAELASFGERPYRAKQILNWAYKKLASSFEDMTDLPIHLRKQLGDAIVFNHLRLLRKQEAQGEWAKRYLWAEGEDPICESVLLKYKYGLTGCLSTQVGCPVGCAFCASRLLGFTRNLTKGEILEEFVGMCREEGVRIGRVVFMGTGEPFLNYANVMDAVDTLCDPEFVGLSRRKVTVSTAGIPDAIRKYAVDSRGSRLALSLHATTDEVRDRLVPMNRRHPIAEVLSALKAFSTSTGQRVTIEYMLLKGINDSNADAERLIDLASGLDCLVNIIPWNEVPGFIWKRPSPQKVSEFRALLERGHVKVTVRRKLGGHIEAACGQLRREMAART